MTIGQQMIEFRARNNMSQSELAKKLNVRQRSISMIENGKQNPRIKLRVKFDLLSKGEL